jgi:hypothetical protein
VVYELLILLDLNVYHVYHVYPHTIIYYLGLGLGLGFGGLWMDFSGYEQKRRAVVRKSVSKGEALQEQMAGSREQASHAGRS